MYAGFISHTLKAPVLTSLPFLGAFPISLMLITSWQLKKETDFVFLTCLLLLNPQGRSAQNLNLRLNWGSLNKATVTSVSLDPVVNFWPSSYLALWAAMAQLISLSLGVFFSPEFQWNTFTACCLAACSFSASFISEADLTLECSRLRGWLASSSRSTLQLIFHPASLSSRNNFKCYQLTNAFEKFICHLCC